MRKSPSTFWFNRRLVGKLPICICSASLSLLGLSADPASLHSQEPPATQEFTHRLATETVATEAVATEAVATEAVATSTMKRFPVTIVPSIKFKSSDAMVHFETDFAGGKIDRLSEIQPREFDLMIRPESEPINDSAWYAFRVYSDSPTEVTVRLRYEGGSHRYEPKISRDRIQWTSSEDLVVRRHPGGRQITMRLSLDEKPLWVAGQELLSNNDLGRWVAALSDSEQVVASVLAESNENRPMHRLAIGNPDAADVVYMLSRQHPPEVTGTIGMMRFVETLTADNELAAKYRDQFLTIVIPIANPDGVAKGYWRTNANGVDLNRDWLRFTQPETRAMRDDLIRLRDGEHKKLWLFLDFHSTYNEVFYTVPRTTALFPGGFTAQWLAAMNNRLGPSKMIRDDEQNSHRSTSKAWVARELGIHAITYEFGDETRRDEIDRIAEGSAEEMMRLLLQRKLDLE